MKPRHYRVSDVTTDGLDPNSFTGSTPMSKIDVLELIQIRWNHKSLQLLSSDELDFIIASVCTSQA